MTSGEPGHEGEAGHEDGRGGAGGTGGAGGDPSGVGGAGGTGGKGGNTGNSAKWISRVAWSMAALALAVSLLVDRVTTSNQLDDQSEAASCRSQIAVDLAVADAEFNLADGQIDLLTNDVVTALIARDNAGLAAAGERIEQANVVAREKAEALEVASQRREDTETICSEGD